MKQDNDNGKTTPRESLSYAAAPEGQADYAGNLFAVLLPLGLIVTITLLFVVPWCTTVFRDFGIQLPGITKLLLMIGRLPTSIIIVTVTWLIVGLTPVVLSRWLQGDPSARTIARRVALACTLLFLAIAAIGLVWPLVTLVRAVSGK